MNDDKIDVEINSYVFQHRYSVSGICISIVEVNMNYA